LKTIDEHDSCGTEYCCILGFELANLKNLRLVNKCNTCYASEDILQTVCRTCISINRKNLFTFNEQCKKLVLSKDYINFYINLAIIANSYPQFMCTTLPIRDIKNNITYLRERMSSNISFWQ